MSDQTHRTVEEWQPVVLYRSDVYDEPRKQRHGREVETYVPISADNVLSEEECADMAAAYFEGTPAALERVEGVISRLADHAKGTPR